MNTKALKELEKRVDQARAVVDGLKLCCRKGPRSKSGRSARKHWREIKAEYHVRLEMLSEQEEI